LSSIRSSPLMEAIERCLDLVDESTMAALQPRLETAMKGAVGLPSKVGCTRVLVSLSTRHNLLFRPYADGFLRQIEKQILDRNETVSSSYAVAAGYVARTATDKHILRLLTFAQSLYFDAAGDRDTTTPRRAISSAEIVHAVSKHASDRFTSMNASFLPFVFLGKHDGAEAVKDLFAETWNEHVAGPRTVSLFLGEILDMAVQHLESAQWALKHTAARTVAAATVALADLSTGFADKTGEVIWPALEKSLTGKTWEGKEVVLDALVRFVQAGRQFWGADGSRSVAAAIDKVSFVFLLLCSINAGPQGHPDCHLSREPVGVRRDVIVTILNEVAEA